MQHRSVLAPASPRAFGLVLLLLTASCFRPQIPNGVVSCSSNFDCFDGMTCQATASDPNTPRLCCLPVGCPGGPAPSAPRPDAAAPPDLAPNEDRAPAPLEAAPPPDAAPIPDVAPEVAADVAPDTAHVAALVTCTRPLSPPPPVAPGSKRHCSIEVQDQFVLLSLDDAATANPIGISNQQLCRVRLDLAAKIGGQAGALGPADLQQLTDVAQHYRALCTELHADDVVGAYATGWARHAINQAEIRATFKERTGLDLEVLTPALELEQRYRGAARNRTGWLVVQSRGTALRLLSRTAGAAVTEVVVSNDLAVGGKMFFASDGFDTYFDARSGYKGALRTELGARLPQWLQLMNEGGLAKDLILDAEDATFALAASESLRSGGGSWDDVASFERKRAQAALAELLTSHGFGWKPVSAAGVTAFMMSISDPQFTQLRAGPIASAYGLYLLGMASFLDLFARELPIGEVGLVSAPSSHGYVLRKRFGP